jgi:hypothetical protein
MRRAGGCNYFLDREVTLGGRRGTYRVRLIAEANMQRAGIGLGIDGDCSKAHLSRSASNAAGNLATIGDQDGFEHAGLCRSARY